MYFAQRSAKANGLPFFFFQILQQKRNINNKSRLMPTAKCDDQFCVCDISTGYCQSVGYRFSTMSLFGRICLISFAYGIRIMLLSLFKGAFMVKDFVLDGSKIPLIPGVLQTQSKLIFRRGKYQPILTVVLYGKVKFN
jgi:hypothetical protein